MKTFVLMSNNYPITVASDFNDFFKNSYPEVKHVQHTGTQSNLDKELAITDIVKIHVTFKATGIFKENTQEYFIHRVREIFVR